MRNKINKKLILLIATTVLLIISMISAVTLGWFEKYETVNIEGIKVSVEDIVELEITKDKVNYIVPSGYNNGLAPGCLGYIKLNLSNENGNVSSIVSVSVDLDNSSFPSNLQFYKGNDFNPQTATLPSDHNSMWSSGKFVSGTTGQKNVIENYSVPKNNTKDAYVAFFWPYNLPDTSSQTKEDNDYGFGYNDDFFIKLTVISVF